MEPTKNPESIKALRYLLCMPRGDAESDNITLNLFDRMMTTKGDDHLIKVAIATTFREIQEMKMATDSGLVADCIIAWRLLYEDSEKIARIVLDALTGDAKGYIQRAGAGIVTGLLELFTEAGTDDSIFQALFQGDLLTCMRESEVTVSQGRLSNVVAKLVKSIWNQNDTVGSRRLPQVMLLLHRYKNLTVKGSAVIFRNLSHDEESKNFLEYFIRMLSIKLFLAGDTELQLFIWDRYLLDFPSSPLKQWEKLFPHLVSAH